MPTDRASYMKRGSARQGARVPWRQWVGKAGLLVGGVVLVCAANGHAQAPPVVESDSAGGRLSLLLNIPAFRLDVLLDSQVLRTYRVAVGMRRYATPTGEFTISSLVWNPWWYPPDAAWAKNDSLTPPGPTNPMGKVKLSMGSLYFLHGTPAVNSLGKAASHGCIRMHNDDAVQLASLIERYHGVAAPDTVRDAASWDWSRTREVRLATLVPVRFVYEVAEVRDSLLTVYPDVYRRTEDRTAHVMNALQQAGIDSTTVSRDVIDRLLRQSIGKPAQMHLRELVIPLPTGASLRRGYSGG
jgi:hypothetical protein